MAVVLNRVSWCIIYCRRIVEASMCGVNLRKLAILLRLLECLCRFAENFGSVFQLVQII